MMKSRVFAALLGCAFLVRAWATDAIENGGITAEQRGQIEGLACQAWNQRPIETFRTEGPDFRGFVRVSLECGSHDAYQGMPLRQTGLCEYISGWTCNQTGLEIALGTAAEPRRVRLIDVTPAKGLELVAFLDAQAKRGRRIKPGLLEGSLTLMGPVDGGPYTAVFDFSEHSSSIEILAKCDAHRCRYRLGESQGWQNF